MPGYIDKKENVMVIAPTSPAELASLCRTAMQELKPTRGVRPKCIPMSDRRIEEMCRGMERNRQILGEEKK